MPEIEISALPLEYWICLLVLTVASALAVWHRDETWAAPSIAVLGTIATWYMVEPIYFEDFSAFFEADAVSMAYQCLLLFLIAFLGVTPVALHLLVPRDARGKVASDRLSIQPERIIPIIIVLWLALLAFGVYRMQGDVLGALLPVGGRTAPSMWSRGAAEDAGAGGFIVSSAAYLYVLVLSLFGLLLPLTTTRGMRAVLVACIFVSWPYAFLQGSRNVTLAVVTPALASYLLYKRGRPSWKVVFAFVGFVGLELAMRAIIAFRNVGLERASLGELESAQHLGLNMASELTHICSLIEGGTLQISYGMGYVAELLNVVPRALWPSKPALGIEYAVARGFAGGGSDIGVFATLSSGVVGQGVLNFGIWLGPIFAGALMAGWVGLLTRLRTQGGTARTALSLVGLGLTFNLGRDVTLLVLFPFVFGYAGLLLLEARERRRLAAGMAHAKVPVGATRGAYRSSRHRGSGR